MQVKKLVLVSDANNNKFYDMNENADGTFTIKYGRIGVTSTEVTYPMSRWDAKYNEKIRKGYIDRTNILLVEEEEANASPTTPILNIDNKKIKQLVRALQSYANTSVKLNYTVSANSVTQLQVDEAQAILNALAFAKKKVDVAVTNKALLNLYSIIPRRMGHVQDYILHTNYSDRQNLEKFNEIIDTEQKTLDVMAGQVKIKTKVKPTDILPGVEVAEDLLTSMGLQISEITKDEVNNILNLLGPEKRLFNYAFRVVNLRSQAAFDKAIVTKQNQTTQLFWHGSRNENWWSILESGLLLRPTNAVINGKMFGYGIYFADKAAKSLGYSSFRGSYWANGGDPNAFLSLFNVHVGNQLNITRHESWCCNLTDTALAAKGKYDSVFAHGGADLRNNEFIIYNQNQTTIQYVVAIQEKK